MSSQRYSPEFREEAARQIVDRGYSVAESRPHGCGRDTVYQTWGGKNVAILQTQFG